MTTDGSNYRPRERDGSHDSWRWIFNLIEVARTCDHTDLLRNHDVLKRSMVDFGLACAILEAALLRKFFRCRSAKRTLGDSDDLCGCTGNSLLMDPSALRGLVGGNLAEVGADAIRVMPIQPPAGVSPRGSLIFYISAARVYRT